MRNEQLAVPEGGGLHVALWVWRLLLFGIQVAFFTPIWAS